MCAGPSSLNFSLKGFSMPALESNLAPPPARSEATEWAWQQKVLPAYKLVLLALAESGDRLSVAELAHKTGVSAKLVYHAIRGLVKRKLITRHKREDRFGNLYELKIPGEKS